MTNQIKIIADPFCPKGKPIPLSDQSFVVSPMDYKAIREMFPDLPELDKVAVEPGPIYGLRSLDGLDAWLPPYSGPLLGLDRSVDIHRDRGMTYNEQPTDLDMWMSGLKAIQEKFEFPDIGEYMDRQQQAQVAQPEYTFSVTKNRTVEHSVQFIVKDVCGPRPKCMVCQRTESLNGPNRSDGSFVCNACSEALY